MLAGYLLCWPINLIRSLGFHKAAGVPEAG